MHVAVLEAVSTDAVFEKLRRQDDWPHESFDGRRFSERADPHGSVTVLRGPTGRSVQLLEAVYYPLLAQPELRPTTCHDSWTIIVSGFLFPDHGRKNFVRAKEGDADATLLIKAQWNASLLERVVLPRLLPAVHAALGSVSNAEADALVSHLRQQLPSFAGGSAAWGKQAMLIRSLRGSGWRLEPFETAPRLLRVPRPTADTHVVVADWLEAAQARLPARFFIFHGHEPLTTVHPASWTSSEVQEVLSTEALKLTGAEETFDYLLRWLHDLPVEIRSDAIRTFVASAAKEGWLGRLTPTLAAKWRLLIEQTSTPFVTIPNELRNELPKLLADLELEVLLLPQDVAPEARREPVVRQLLPLLRRLDVSPDGEAAERLGLSVLSALSPERAAQLLEWDECADLRCFVIRDAMNPLRERVTCSRIRDLLTQRRLFVMTGIARPEQALSALARAIAEPDFRVYALEAKTQAERHDLGKALGARTLEASSLVEPFLAASPPRLQPPAERKLLLERLLEAYSAAPHISDAEVRVFRYLIHGDRVRIDRISEPLWFPIEALAENSDLVARLLSKAEQAWRLVDRELWEVAHLDQRWRRRLTLRDLDAAQLREVCAEYIAEDLRSALETSSDEGRVWVATILGDSPAAHRVPAFRTVGGSSDFVAAEDRGVYLWSDEIPVELHAFLRLVVVLP